MFTLNLFFFVTVGSCGSISSARKPPEKTCGQQLSASSTSKGLGGPPPAGMGTVQMGTSGKNASEVLTRAYLPMQTLFMYDQMTVLAREAGAPLPPIRNPGLVIKDVTMPLIEGIHYDPNEFVIQPGKDLFKQDKLLALYGKKQI